MDFQCLSHKNAKKPDTTGGRKLSKFRLGKLFGKLRRRRGSQGSNPSKAGRPYFIPTAGKPKSVDVHGLVNPESERAPTNSVEEDEDDENEAAAGVMATSATVAPRRLSKTTNEPSDSGVQLRSTDEKEKKRSLVQPPGTFVYTVGRNDTLNSIAAHFETTPSELVKINRLVSRLIFPGQPLYVPENLRGEKVTTSTSDQDSKDASLNGVGVGNISEQGSPKPGHAERIQSPTASPTRLEARCVAASDEPTDRVRTQKFLKINVKHITDGQGVVGGVLLVTPNAVMFDPSVMDTLVMEHGADKYGVIAPMDYVANAALYSDIAHMRVKHAPHNILPHPEIYHSKTCPMFKREGSEPETSEPVAGQPSRSESQQAVKGSISDKAELSEEDDEVDDEDNNRDGEEGFGAGSECSCRTGSKGSAAQSPDDNSEVFVPEIQDHDLPKRSADKIVSARKTLASSTNVSFESMETEAGGKRMERVPSEGSEAAVAEQSLSFPAQIIEVEGAQTEVVSKEFKLASDLPKDQQLFASKDSEETFTRKISAAANTGSHSLLPFVVEGLKKSLSQSAPASDEDSDGGGQHPTSVSTRKHSIPEVQVSTEKLRLKMLKRLSYPLWSTTETYEEKDQEQQQPRNSDGDGGLSIPVKSPLNESQTTLSRILNSASPKNLVDFSTGIFMKSADCVGKVADVSQLPKLPPSWIPPPSPNLDGWVETTKNLLTGGRRGSTSPDAQGLCEARNPNITDYGFFSAASAASKSEGKRGSRVEFKNEVADKLELFQTLDKLIPRPAQSCDDPPLYLCLRMGRPLNKKVISTTPTMSYGRRKMKSEYWFSIPKDRVDDLYSFFQHWAPGVYGDFNAADVEERGFKLVEPDDDASDDDINYDEQQQQRQRSSSSFKTDDASDFRRRSDSETPGSELPSWERLIMRLRKETKSSDSEIVSALDVVEHDDIRQMSLDMESLLPELIGHTEILTDEHRRQIGRSLPARAFGYAWSLIFSASQHGFSLQSMYRRMAHFETPVLLVIQDTENNVFGAMTSCTLRVSDHFYGTGESFLFTFHPEFKVFKWSGENVFFIKGNPESLAIGAGDGVFGLWLDGDLYHGHSHSCKTYNNDMLTSDEDFCIKTIEAWGYVEFGAMDSTC